MSRTHDVTISAFDLDRLEAELTAVTEQRDEAREKLATERALADRLALQLEPLLIATWKEKPPTKAELAFEAWVDVRSEQTTTTSNEL
jgi:hypothetical protein